MDKYFEKKFEITTSDYQYEVKNLIGIIKDGLYYKIIFDLNYYKTKTPEFSDVDVDYDIYNKQIKISCVNLSFSDVTSKFNTILNNIFDEIKLDDSTNILLYTMENSDITYYKTTYAVIKRFQIK